MTHQPCRRGAPARSTEVWTRSDYRGVDLKSVGSMLAGSGSIFQPKWAAWRRKEGFEDICDESLDVQVGAVAAVLDPVFARGRATRLKPS